MNLESQVSDVIRELRQVSVTARRHTSRILGKHAKPVVDALFAAAPHGNKINRRYKKAGLSGRIRAPKGKGQVVAIYRPGNLATSFRIFRFKGAKYSLQIGAKFAKNYTGAFGPGTGRNDAYYTHIAEKRTPFIVPTWLMMKPTVANGAINHLRRVIEKLNK